MRAVLAALAVIAVPAMADTEQFERTIEKLLESRYETTASLHGAEHARFLYGAYTTFSLLGADDSGGRTRIRRQIDARFWMQVDNDGHTLYGRLRLSHFDWNTGDSFDGNDDDLVDPVGDRYWYRFDWRQHEHAENGTDPSFNFWVQVGRQYIHWASGIALSDDLFAVRAGVEIGKLEVDGFIALTPRDTVDFDASRPRYNTDTDRRLYGVKATLRGTGHRPYVFFLGQEDENNPVSAGAFGPVMFHYDSIYIAVGSVGELTGSILYRIEILHESGDSASDILAPVAQAIDDIDAWAGRLQLVYSSPVHRHTSKLRFELEVLLGTGDDDRATSNMTAGGNAPGTSDHAFNAFGFVNTGLVIAPEIANLVSLRLSASLFPLHGRGVFDRLQLRVDVFFFRKLDGGAPISIATVPGGSTIGGEVDFAIVWNVYSDFAIDLRYGVFFPGGAYSDGDARHFVYLGISYGF